jgi:hypothetical protein
MCPACLATVAMIVAGTTSTGVLAAFLAKKFHVKIGAKESIAVRKVKGLQAKENAS